MLTITLSELMSDVQVTQTRMDGRLEKSGEAQRLQTSLQQMALSETSKELLRDCGLPESTLEAKPDEGPEDLWNWTEMVDLSATLLKALDAATEHALMVCNYIFSITMCAIQVSSFSAYPEFYESRPLYSYIL